MLMNRSISLVVALHFLAGQAVADGNATTTGMTLADARRMAAAAISEASRTPAAVVIAVVDGAGQLVLLERMENGLPASVNVAMGKARTAALFGRRTGDFEQLIADGRRTLTALPDFTPLQGGVPIVRNGQVVGAVGVSGVTAAKDEEIARAGVATTATTHQ